MTENQEYDPFDGRLLAGLSVLATVARSGSFVAAGRSLGLTPSGVSRAVSRLEARLGVRLLSRSTRSLALTDTGRDFLSRITPSLQQIAEAADDIHGADSRASGRLRVNMDSYLSRRALAGHLGAFLDAHPDLSLELISREGLGDMVAEGIDLAVRFGEPPLPAATVRKLAEFPVLTLASPAYIARHGRPRHPAELTGHNAIWFRDPQAQRPYAWEFRRGEEIVSVTPHSRLVVSDLETKLTECINGFGIAQALDFGISPLLRSGQLEVLLADWGEERFPLYAIFPSGRFVPRKTRVFVDFLVRIMAGMTAS